MVPDKFNMVDMEGIDLIESQGLVVEGLYDKLVESIAQCRYQCLYNWKFDGIVIPPSYVEMEVDSDTGDVVINEGVIVDVDDIIHIHSIEIIVEPTILELRVTQNGEYSVPEGFDGFNPVTVNVNPPLESLSVTENGNYSPSSGKYGFSDVSVDVNPPLESLSVTENGNYSPSSGKYGFSEVIVDVESSSPVLTPFYENLHSGFVSDGVWYIRNPPEEDLCSDVYRVEAGKHYLIYLTTPVGNRFRAMYNTANPVTATSDIYGATIGRDISDPSQYVAKSGSNVNAFYTPMYDGYITIFKSNIGQSTIKTYVLCAENI